MAPLQRARSAQDGQSLGETAVYNAFWNHSRARETKDSHGVVIYKTLSIGWDRLAAAASISRNTAKKHCKGLAIKLSIEQVKPHNSEKCRGAEYRVYSYVEILAHRKAAGLTHYTNVGGKVTLVNPSVRHSTTPLVTVDPGQPLVGDPCQCLPGVPLVAVAPPLVIEQSKKAPPSPAACRPAPVSAGSVVAEQILESAASQEPPNEMLFTESAAARPQFVEEGWVEDALNTQTDLAPVALEPPPERETAESVSSPAVEVLTDAQRALKEQQQWPTWTPASGAYEHEEATWLN
jgi:hypothetical protein